MAGRLLERANDLDTIDGLVRAGAVGVVEGPAGIGKTALLDAACQRAEALNIRVVRARASELEHGFAYGVVRQLLEPVVARLEPEARAGLFTGPARPAALVLGAEHDAHGGASFGVLHGLYWAVIALAGETPLVLCVDDAHWADRPSLRFLAHLTRRLEGTSTAVLLGVRTAEPEAADELLDALREGARIVRPAPLSGSAVLEVVRDELGPAADEAFSLACHRASAGNPFYLRELLRALGSDTVVPSREQVELVAEVWPASIARQVLRRVARLGEGAVELAGAMAVLGDGGRLRHAAAVAGVEEAGALARGLLEMEILAEEEPFRFSHPVVRGAVYADLTYDARERFHLRAARLLIGERGEPERIAAHVLAVAPGDRAWCADALRSAARRAAGRGAPDIAVRYLRRAVAERPVADAGLLRELGMAEEQSADPAAVGHLQQAWTLSGDVRERSEIALDLARTLQSRGQAIEAVDVIRSALAGPELSGDLELRLQVALISAASSDARATGPGELEIFSALLVEVPDGVAGQVTQALTAGAAAWIGAPALVAVQRAEDACARGLLAGEHWDAIGSCLWALILCERYDAAAEQLAYLRDAVERRGHARGIALVLQLQANRAERVGALAEAESSARLALDVMKDSELAVGGLAWILCSLLEVLVERGDLAEAEAALALMPAGEWPPHLGCLSALAARGRMRMAQNRPEESRADLLEVGRRYRTWPGFPLNGPAPSLWRSSAALAAQRLGDDGEARQLAAEELEAARAFGTPRAIGIALRVAGTVAPAGEALPLLEESVDVLNTSEAMLERARASIALGAALRRRGQRVAARTPLHAGLDGARRCGANPLAGFAHQELLAAGARPRRDAISGLGALTASERRVADLAAEGLTNRQLAQILYLSPKTVEMHLSRVYRKLDLSSRTDLAAALRG
jgi:DNA-binding CsgD family transcriptional regulator